jgi:hypothetical protein
MFCVRFAFVRLRVLASGEARKLTPIAELRVIEADYHRQGPLRRTLHLRSSAAMDRAKLLIDSAHSIRWDPRTRNPCTRGMTHRPTQPTASQCAATAAVLSGTASGGLAAVLHSARCA